MSGYRYRGIAGWDPAKLRQPVVLEQDEEPEPVSFVKYRHTSHPRERCGCCGEPGPAFQLHDYGAPKEHQGNHHG